MSRPKGSKNRKTLQDEALIESHIEQQRELLSTLREEEAALQAALAEDNRRMKDKRREIRTAARTLEKLTQRKSELEAEVLENARRAEIEKVVISLMNSGKGAQEILSMVNEK